MTVEQIDALLSEAGPLDDGIVGIARTADDRWAIQFEDVDVEVEFSPETGRLLFATTIGTPPAARAPAIHEAMLSYTMLWRETGGVRMGLAGPGGEAVQMVDFPVAELRPDVVATVAVNLAARTLIWRGFLNDDSASARPPGGDIQSGDFIRI
jgi:hypothetical protein